MTRGLCRTIACSRRPTASASLRLPGAAEARRSVPKAQRNLQYLIVLDVSVLWAGPPPRLSWGGTEIKTTGRGEHRDAPEAPVVERAHSRRARRAGGCDGGGGGCTVSPDSRGARGSHEVDPDIDCQ